MCESRAGSKDLPAKGRAVHARIRLKDMAHIERDILVADTADAQEILDKVGTS